MPHSISSRVQASGWGPIVEAVSHHEHVGERVTPRDTADQTRGFLTLCQATDRAPQSAHAPGSVLAGMIRGFHDSMNDINAGCNLVVERHATKIKDAQKHEHPKDGKEQVAVVHSLTPSQFNSALT